MDYNKWLAVDESKNRGWWVPAGAVDYDQSFSEAAKRECEEEAGIQVDLKGILKVDHGIHDGDQARMRVIFYSEPTSIEQAHSLKTIPDKESNSARWVTLQELLEMRQPQGNHPGWRSDELYVWGSYLEKGGQIFPLAMFDLPEGQKQKSTDKAYNIFDQPELQKYDQSSNQTICLSLLSKDKQMDIQKLAIEFGLNHQYYTTTKEAIDRVKLAQFNLNVSVVVVALGTTDNDSCWPLLKLLQGKNIPIFVYSNTAATQPTLKQECIDLGANLVTNDLEEIQNGMEQVIGKQGLKLGQGQSEQI